MQLCTQQSVRVLSSAVCWTCSVWTFFFPISSFHIFPSTYWNLWAHRATPVVPRAALSYFPFCSCCPFCVTREAGEAAMHSGFHRRFQISFRYADNLSSVTRSPGKAHLGSLPRCHIWSSVSLAMSRPWGQHVCKTHPSHGAWPGLTECSLRRNFMAGQGTLFGICAPFHDTRSFTASVLWTDTVTCGNLHWCFCSKQISSPLWVSISSHVK